MARRALRENGGMVRVGSIIVTAALAALALVALGLSIYALPTRLTVAVGPDDREHTRIMTAFARKLQQDRAPVRLSLLRLDSFGDASRAMEGGRADLAVVRSDLMPRNGQSVAVVAELPVLFMAPVAAPAGRRVRRVADLAGRRVGVTRGTPENLALLDTVLAQAGIASSKVERVPLEPNEAPAALMEHRVDVLMMAAPLSAAGASDRTLQAIERTHMRVNVFGVTEAEAIAKRDPTFEAIEVPRGALRGEPVTPDDDLPTLAPSLRLVARDKLSQTVVNNVTRLLFTGRVALAAEVPAAKSIRAPDTEMGAALQLHPGAATYLTGERNSFFHRYGDPFYIGAMLATGVASSVGALFNFVLGRQRRSAAQFTHQVLDLLARARTAESLDELARVEHEADELLALAFKRVSDGSIDSDQFSTFAMLNDSVHMAVARRHALLAASASMALA